MKIQKVLIGLIVAGFVGFVQFAGAQPKANYQNGLVEIGPDNIAGRVRALVVDEADANHQTLFAGGVAGGLFRIQGEGNWQYVPCYDDNGKELTLPISCMIQLPNNDLLIGTGEGLVTNHGVNNDMMAPKGRGMYIYNRRDGVFSRISSTNPIIDADFSYVNSITKMVRGNKLYILVATDGGLFRWELNADNPNWSTSFSKVASGRFLHVIAVTSDNIAYATAPGKVYRLGNIEDANATLVDVTSSNPSFATSSRVEMATATYHDADNHTTMLYAVVADSTGLLDGVFLTKDQQNWTRLTTSTVTPFTSTNPGSHNASIAIDPLNYKHIYVGGATLWSGEGFVENSYYQWTKSSYSESELNGGNYMSFLPKLIRNLHAGCKRSL